MPDVHRREARADVRELVRVDGKVHLDGWAVAYPPPPIVFEPMVDRDAARIMQRCGVDLAVLRDELAGHADTKGSVKQTLSAQPRNFATNANRVRGSRRKKRSCEATPHPTVCAGKFYMPSPSRGEGAVTTAGAFGEKLRRFLLQVLLPLAE